MAARPDGRDVTRVVPAGTAPGATVMVDGRPHLVLSLLPQAADRPLAAGSNCPIWRPANRPSTKWRGDTTGGCRKPLHCGLPD